MTLIPCLRRLLVASQLLVASSCNESTPNPSQERPLPSSAPQKLEPASPLMPSLPPADQKVHAPGEMATAAHYKMRVDKVEECKVKEYFAPAPGNIKLGVLVTVEATADKDVPVNPFYAKVLDSEGISWTSTLAGCSPDLKSLRLNSGETAQGWITFEIPKSARSLRLAYAPFIVGSAKQELVFELGR